MKSTTFAAACKEYFGLQPGQNLSQFLEELKQLTPADRDEFIRLFPSVGFTIVSAR